MADVRVNLAFTADTSKAQAAIQSLQQSLSQLSSASVKGSMSKEMEQASAAAKELQYHLNQAFNAKTGNFDLSRLDKSLKSSGQNIDVLSSKLLGAGQQGQQVFMQLAQSIAAAERPSITLSKRMTDLFTTLKNTAKWQISSSVLHGFIGAVQQAYGYAQDLNESLNNIRIVTGYSIDKMAQFAGEANKAAKALSTTTTAYTDASLIYYQQGLDDKEVKERTDVTVKLANVARESTTTVSDQMTAVWNNFADGSKSLEYYADVITKLGAATAASNSEIAEGIEKFSAISNTVGLSYEYATSALTTVVDRTRQSADVVGTAFKTMFARIQGLKLGETLEDGTTLNQYSQALQSVGINIKESNGELKDMDVILDEMGAKWKELNRDEQVALAQKVAGVRQYQQLVSLMENYDFFKENVELARNSEGALQEQANIYAESWEAAQKRVKAAAEGLYSDLLDDSFFIKMNNGLAALLGGIDKFIDGIGGIGNLIIGIGSIFLGVFADKIPNALNNLKANLSVVFQGAEKSVRKLSTEMTNVIQAKMNDPNMNFSTAEKQNLANATGLIEAKTKLAMVSKNLTDKEKQEAEMELTVIAAEQKEAIAIAELIDKKRTELNQLQVEAEEQVASTEKYEALAKAVEKYGQAADEAIAKAQQSGTKADWNIANDALIKYEESEAKLRNVNNTLQEYKNKIIDAMIATQQLANGMENEKITVEGLKDGVLDVSKLFANYKTQLENIPARSNMNQIRAAVQEVRVEFEAITDGTIPEVTQAFNNVFKARSRPELLESVKTLVKELENAKIKTEDFQKIAKKLNFGSYGQKLDSSFKAFGETQKNLIKRQELLNKLILNFKPEHVVTGIERLTRAASMLGSISMTINSFKSMIQALNNEDMSFGEKLSTVLMSISMIVPSTVSVLSNLNSILGITQGISEGLAAAKLKQIAAMQLEQTVLTEEYLIEKAGLSQDEAAIILSKLKAEASLEEAAKNEEVTTSMLAKLIAAKTGLSVDEATVVAIKLKTAATAGETAGEEASAAASKKTTVARLAEAAATKTLGTEVKKLWASMGPALGILAVIAAVTAAIVLAIKKVRELDQAQKDASAEAQWERMSEIAKKAKEEYSNAVTEYDNLKNKIASVQDARNGLASLQEGTAEWRAELIKTNTEATELINKFNLLAGSDYTTNKGIISFTSQGMEKMYNSQEADLARSSANQIVSMRLENQKYIDKSIEQKAHTFEPQSFVKEDVNSFWNVIGRALEGAFYGANAMASHTDSQLEMVGVSPKDIKLIIDQYKNNIEKDPVYTVKQAIEDLINSNSFDDTRVGAVILDQFNGNIEGLESSFQSLISSEQALIGSNQQLDSSLIALANQDQEDSNKKDWDLLNQIAAWDKGTSNTNQQKAETGLEGKTELEKWETVFKKLYGDDWKNKYQIQDVEDGSNGQGDGKATIYKRNDQGGWDQISSGENLDFLQDYIDQYLGIEGAERSEADYARYQSSLDAARDSIISTLGDLGNIQGYEKEDYNTLIDQLSMAFLSAQQNPDIEGEYDVSQINSDLLNSLISVSDIFDKFQLDEENQQILDENGKVIDESTSPGLFSLLSTIISLIDKENNNDTDADGIDDDYGLGHYYDKGEAIKEKTENGFEVKGYEVEKRDESTYQAEDRQSETNTILSTITSGDTDKQVAETQEEIDKLTKSIMKMDKESNKLAESLTDDADAAKLLATNAMQTQKGFDKLKKGFATWKEAIASKDIAKSSIAMTDLKDALADVMNISDDLAESGLTLGDHFGNYVAKNMDKVEKAMNGDRDAILDLQKVAGQDYLIQLGAVDASKLIGSVQDATSIFNEQFDSIRNLVNSGDLKFGPVDNTALLSSLTQTINAMTTDVQTAEKILANLGFNAKVNKKPITKTETTWVPAEYTTEPLTTGGEENGGGVFYQLKKVKDGHWESKETSDGDAVALEIETADYVGGGNISSAPGGTTPPGGSCFVAGTQVSLGESFKNIENIQVGDIVLSYNEKTNKNEYSKVLQTMIHFVNEEIYELYIENEVLSVTGIHRFLIKQNNLIKWIAAKELQIDNQVFFANGTWHKIKDIKVSIQLTTVYNFEVANNHNYYVGQNQILAHNKGGGGGGGGSSTPAEKKDYTKKSDVVDRYKQINDKLGTVNKNLDKYNKLSDLAYGKNKLKMMNNILNAYKQEIKLQQQLSAEAKKYLPEDKKNLETAAADLGTSKLKYDNDGNVKNIESIQGEIFVKIHAAEEKYNSFATKEQQDEYNKSTLEPLMKQYEEFKNYLSKYEETKQQIADAEAAELDAQISYMDTKLEKISRKRQQRIEIRNTEINLFERELEKLENQAFATGRRVTYLTAELKALEDQGQMQIKNIKSNLLNGIYLTDENGDPKKNKDGTIKTLNDTKYKDYNLDTLLSKISDSDFWKTHELNDKYADSLKETLESLIELDRSFDALKEKIDGEILNTFERWQKVMDRYTKTMDHYINTANTWLDIINAVGEKNLGWNSQQMQEYRQQYWNTQKNQARADYEKYLISYDQFKSAKEGYKTIKNDKKKEANEYTTEAKAHEDKATDYEKKYDKIYGSYYTKQIEKERAERQEIADKLKNPEKYYGDKNYFSTEKGKKEKANLEERDAKLKEKINKNKETYQDTIEHKRAVREKIAIKLKEEQTKLDKARTKMDVKAAEAAAKEIDRLEKKDALYKEQIINLKKQANEYKNLADAEHELAENENEQAKAIKSEIEAIDQELDTMRETVRANREQIYKDLLDLIEASKENVSAYLNDVLKDFEKKVSGAYDSISQMQEAFDQNKTIADRYLQDTEKIYELTKMNRDLEKKMDETTNLKAKEKLAKFQEQILKYAKEGVKMSEYDLEIMQKQYDLEVAKIALEEAQNNKTQVRLTRDADGNYSYTYTADENKTADAEQNYEDKLNDLIKYNNDYQLQMQEAILNTEKAEADAIARLTEMWENNEITYDEFVSRATQAHAYYHSQLQYYAQENEKASENSMNAFVQEYDAYYTNTDKKIHVTQVFSDEIRKTYEQVHQIYQDAAIARDQALYEEEERYKTFQLEMARRLKEGEITQQEYDETMEIWAKQHSDNLDAINKDYTAAVNREVTLQNDTRLSASEYFRSLIIGDQTTNSEVIAGMEASNKGFILNTETEYLPGLGNIYTQATKTVENFANKVTDGQGDTDGKTLLGQIKQGMQDHEANVAAAEEAIGILLDDEGDAYKDLAEEATKQMGDMETKSDELIEKVEQAGKDARDDMDLTVEKVKKWYTDSKPYLNKMKKKIDKVTAAITEMLAAAAGIKPITVEADTEQAVKNLKNLKKAYEDLMATQKKTSLDPVTPITPTTPTAPTTQTGLSNKEKLEIAKKVAASIWLLGDWKNEEGSGKDRKWKLTQVFGSTGQSYIQGKINTWTKSGEINQIASDYSKYASDFTWAKMKKYADSDKYKFATGGYTGQWGADGRWALLHEKELVLNREDTENMLAAVKTVREIAAIVDLQAQQANLASQYTLALGQIQNGRNAQVDQNVHITAEFPNVQDHNEVELALTSLVNRASQFAWQN